MITVPDARHAGSVRACGVREERCSHGVDRPSGRDGRKQHCARQGIRHLTWSWLRRQINGRIEAIGARASPNPNVPFAFP
jgi:hypothetical protein